MTLRFRDLIWTQAIPRYADAWTALLLRGGLDPSLLPDWVACGADAAGRLQDLRVFLTFDGVN